MSIVAIISSPEKGNTEALVNAAIEGAKENGQDVKTFYINKMTNRRGCQACMGCKKAGKCVVKDDITPVLDAVRDADGIILSTPVYFGQVCGQFKLVEDRFWSFLDPAMKPNMPTGKKLAVITTAGTEGADELADRLAGEMNFYAFDLVGKLSYITHNDPKAASKDQKILDQAKALGKKF